MYGYSLIAVSIPYSTIKRLAAALGVPAFLEFQFLIVQLKVVEDDDMFSAYIVSIPYSTIKSKCINVDINAVPRFQFLIVQLKANRSKLEVLMMQSFNSL